MQGFILPFFIQRRMEGDDIGFLDQRLEGAEVTFVAAIGALSRRLTRGLDAA